MAMPIVVVEVQNLVGVPNRLGELARPIIATAGNCMCGDEQVSIGTQTGPLSASKRDPFRCGIDEANDVSLFG